MFIEINMHGSPKTDENRRKASPNNVHRRATIRRVPANPGFFFSTRNWKKGVKEHHQQQQGVGAHGGRTVLTRMSEEVIEKW